MLLEVLLQRMSIARSAARLSRSTRPHAHLQPACHRDQGCGDHRRDDINAGPSPRRMVTAMVASLDQVGQHAATPDEKTLSRASTLAVQRLIGAAGVRSKKLVGSCTSMREQPRAQAAEHGLSARAARIRSRKVIACMAVSASR